jgi:hypothetical protein
MPSEPNLAKPHRTYLKWWLLPGAVTLLLLAFNSPWMKLYSGGLVRRREKTFGLFLEMNFAVWWSSIIYLLSAALFYEIASREVRHRRRAYLGLSLLMLLMVADEIGSLHEWISSIGGWTALAPFGLGAVLLLGDSLRRLWRDREARPVLWLVLIGFLLMGSVAFQEYAEHNLTTRSWSRWYGRFIEESTELVGAWIILIAAVYRRQARRWGGPLAAVVPDPTRMNHLVPILCVGFLAHLLAAQLRLVDVGEWGGSPSAVYPFAVCFLLFCYAFWAPRHRRAEDAPPEVWGFWTATGIFFLACSIGTMQNLWQPFGRLVPGLSRRMFYEVIPLWIAMLLVVFFIGLALWRWRDRRLLWLLALPLAMTIRLELHHAQRQDLATGLFALLCALALMRPDGWAAAGRRVECSPDPPINHLET